MLYPQSGSNNRKWPSSAIGYTIEEAEGREPSRAMFVVGFLK